MKQTRILLASLLMLFTGAFVNNFIPSMTTACLAQDSPFPERKTEEPMIDESLDPDFFMKANFEFSLYHEISHALFDILEIPILGNEEIAADHMAIFMMLYPKGKYPEANFLPKLAAISGEWLVEWQESANMDNRDYSDPHPLEIQRFYEIGCISYGSNPDSLERLRKEQLLPSQRAITCKRDYESFLKSTELLFRRWGRKENDPPSSVKIKIEIEKPSNDFEKKVYDWLNQSHILEDLVEKVSQLIELPEAFTVGIYKRGMPTAYWNSETRYLAICYELLEKFWNNASKAKAAMLELENSQKCNYNIQLTDEMDKQLKILSNQTGKSKKEIIEMILNQELPCKPCKDSEQK